MVNGVIEKESFKEKVLKIFFNKYIIKGIIILIIILMVAVGVRGFISYNSKSTKLGFEDIGEFATQTAYCTEINVTDKAKEFYGVTIPFTQSKSIYSYDIVIKAGFDFEEIEWKKNDTSIEVKLPQPKILSSEIKAESFKIYHEDQSIFTPITISENNEAMIALKQSAEENAVENGLLENARINVETILKGFFGNQYDMDKYEIVFKDK